MTRTHRIVIFIFSWLGTVPQALSDVERILSVAPNSASYGKHLLHLTEDPHIAGGIRSRE